ncbi:poly(beta-D-mannuronate) lyase [Lutibacter oricola]|uniref:Poly(Beta-D-mannuronate) lyase n=1 Tax=Lutibacter oricola TaxID=762486 RepID=A0A1H3FQW3_9FLAO|nr:polysaccharide lyase 6 family protein [Lutibacter oricola]SDX93462.1 poly(beta-D-mannuronate) lyase [Lutibacter oricola]
MKTNILITLFIVSSFCTKMYTQASYSTLVATETEFTNALKNAKPGSEIVLKNGEWKNAQLLAIANGTKESPIIITAQTDGEVIFTGNSSLTIAGKHLIINGLWFKNGIPTSKSVISFRKDSKNFANNCRVTNCTISNYNPTDVTFQTHWVDLWGKNNRVDHCNFTGKTNIGSTLVVWLKGDEHTENNHQIDHNFFGFRPDLGENGGETIRIGTSTNSLKSSKTTVAYNTFKQCNGEIEIISNKSCDNIFNSNLFLESEGTLTLRHGNNALVENNVFIGNNKPRTGGIRIINKGHIVQNNFLIGLTGDDYRAPIVFMNGVPNSPLNRYHQVEDVLVQNNTIINCGTIVIGAGKDSEKSLAPINSSFVNNLVSNTNGKQLLDLNDANAKITFEGNIGETTAEINSDYFTKAAIEWQLLKSLPMPTANNTALTVSNYNKQSPSTDICNTTRTNLVAGAFNLNNQKIPSAILSKSGPLSWKPTVAIPTNNKPTTNIATVKPGVGTLEKAIKNAAAGSTLTLESGTYFLKNSVQLKKSIHIIGVHKDSVFIKANAKLEKPLSYLFRVQENCNFNLENVTLSGQHNKLVKYAIVSPNENEKAPYTLTISNCIFRNFKNKNGGSIFKAYVGTFANEITIKNSLFEDSYRGLNLSYEKGTTGNYNAGSVSLEYCVFKNMEQFAVSYTKAGNYFVNKGGKLSINHCIFSKVYDTEKGYILKNSGIDTVEITNSIFEKSYNLKTPFKLAAANHSVKNTLIYTCGTPKISGMASKAHIYTKNPKWEDAKHYIPNKKSILLKANNGIENIGVYLGSE